MHNQLSENLTLPVTGANQIDTINRDKTFHKIKLLYLIPSLQTGGAETQLLALISGLDPQRYDITLAVLYRAGKGLEKQFENLKYVKIHYLGKKAAYDLSYLYRLGQLLNRQPYDIIEGINISARLLTIIFAKVYKIPHIVIAERNSKPVYSSLGSRVWYFFEKHAIRSAHILVANSEPGRQFCIERGVHPRRIRVINNGIDLKRLEPRKSIDQVNEIFRIPPNAPVVGMVARMFPQKDHFCFLNAAKLVLQKRPETFFLLVGGGPIFEKVQHFAKQLDIHKHVIFTGDQQEIGSLIKRMDFAVLSSNKSEGSSNALVEIMSFGKAVVVTDVVGNRELITCGVNGYIVKPQSPEEISEKIIYLLENDEKRKILGQNARQHTYDHFSYEQMIKAYEHVYTDLMHGYFQNISNSKTCGRDRFIRKKVQPLDRIKILDIPIDCLSLDQCVEKLIDVIPERRSFYIIVVNAAKLVKAQRDPELAQIIRSADLVGTDGVPIVWVSKFFKKSLPGRVNGTDLMYKLLETAAIKGYRIYLLGARQSVIERAVENLKDKYPALEICGYRNGYFESESEAETVVAEIAHLDVDILLIGMGSPMKEKWVHKYRQRLGVSIIHGVGGSFDILGGITKRAPEWMQKCGLEWLFRLYQEPKRLWKRYLILNVVFIWLVFKEGFYRFSGKSN